MLYLSKKYFTNVHNYLVQGKKKITINLFSNYHLNENQHPSPESI